MNHVSLDQALERVIADPTCLALLAADPASFDITPEQAGWIADGDLRSIAAAGAHPLLVMQIAEVLGIDPVATFADEEDK